MPSRSRALSATDHPPATPRRRLLARGGAALVAAATSLGTLIALEGTALAEPYCGSEEGAALYSAFGSGETFSLEHDLSVMCSLELGSNTELTIQLNSHMLTINGPHGSFGEAGSEALIVNGTLRVSNGTLTVVGGSGGEGNAGGANGGTALRVGSGGSLGLTGVGLTVTGGSGGDGPSESGAGGNGGEGVYNTGVITFTGSSLHVTGGSGGDGYNGGNGGVAFNNTNAGAAAFYFEPGDSVSPSPLSCDDSAGGAGAGGNNGSDYIGCESVYQVMLDGNGATDPAKALVLSRISIEAAVGRLGIWGSRDGYTFDGWYGAADGGGEDLSRAIISNSVLGTVYAHWTPVDEDDGDDHGGGDGGAQTSSVTSSVETTELTTSTTTPVETTTSPAPTTQTPTSTTPVPTPLPTGTDAADLGVDDPTPGQGGRIVLTAQGFQPGSVVDFWIHSTPVYLGSAVADSEGVATLPVVLDKQYVGVHHVQAVGVGPDGQVRNVAQQITVSAPPALAETGPVTWPLLLLALELLAAGVALIQWQQRDRRGGRTHR